MPSLIRFVVLSLLLAAIVFAGMLALATFVKVTPRPMEQAIPASKLK